MSEEGKKWISGVVLDTVTLLNATSSIQVPEQPLDLNYEKDPVTGVEKTTAVADSYPLDNGFACAKLAASIDGGETLIPLVFDNGTKPTQMTATAEIDAAKLMGFEGGRKGFRHGVLQHHGGHPKCECGYQGRSALWPICCLLSEETRASDR